MGSMVFVTIKIEQHIMTFYVFTPSMNMALLTHALYMNDDISLS